MKIFRPVASLCMMLIATLASADALADVLVLRSDAAHLTAGSSLKAGSLLRVKKGRAVLLLQADGTTLELRGPATFIIPEKQDADQSLIQAFTAMFKARADTVRLGGVRDGNTVVCVEEVSQESWKGIADNWNAGCREAALSHLSAQLK
jgi:hypothetical protein